VAPLKVPTQPQVAESVLQMLSLFRRPKSSILGSREQLCVHHDISKLRGVAQNTTCRATVQVLHKLARLWLSRGILYEFASTFKCLSGCENEIVDQVAWKPTILLACRHMWVAIESNVSNGATMVMATDLLELEAYPEGQLRSCRERNMEMIGLIAAAIHLVVEKNLSSFHDKDGSF
jgi:hypothetical protein